MPLSVAMLLFGWRNWFRTILGYMEFDASLLDVDNGSRIAVYLRILRDLLII